MAVGTQSLKVGWFIVPSITVDMVNVELTDVDWLEPTVLAVVFLMDCVWVLRLVVCLLVDSFALVPSSEGDSFAVPQFDSSGTAD